MKLETREIFLIVDRLLLLSRYAREEANQVLGEERESNKIIILIPVDRDL